MRKTLIALSAAAALAASAASPVAANPRHHHQHGWLTAPAVGAVTGTVVGFGLYEGWFGTGNSVTAGALGSTTAAFSGGIIAGAGTAALIHAATTPCQGFHALFGGAGCVNGRYVGR
jgi:hypothetical protein